MLFATEKIFKNLALIFIDRNFRKYILMAVAIGGKKRYQKCTVKIDSVKFQVPDNRSFLAQFLEIFVNEIYNFNSVNDKPLIIDCGANIGTSVLYFKKLYPQSMIKAFEPDPGIYSILQQNIDTAKFENIHLFNKAVWTKDSVLNFHSEGSDAGSISDNGGPNLKVKAIQLSKFLAECPQNIDLLKIDIEGAEYEVLLSCKDQLSKVDNIFVECHKFPNQPQRIHEVLKMFEDLNFRYYIQNEAIRKRPFINKKEKELMDMQLNIFAYRKVQHS